MVNNTKQMFKSPPKPPAKKACAFRMRIEAFDMLHELADAYDSTTAICVEDLVLTYAPAAIKAANKKKAGIKSAVKKQGTG